MQATHPRVPLGVGGIPPTVGWLQVPVPKESMHLGPAFGQPNFQVLASSFSVFHEKNIQVQGQYWCP